MVRIHSKIMENLVPISNLNDFIFCPISIYFHNLYMTVDDFLYKNQYQFLGTKAHDSIDNKVYSSKKSCLMSISVASNELGIVGKIDMFDIDKRELIERKRHISKIYDGFILQLYAQYYCLMEMGYLIEKLSLYSLSDNKKYSIPLPQDNMKYDVLLLETITSLMNFEPSKFVQTNQEKCLKCIYSNACDRCLS